MTDRNRAGDKARTDSDEPANKKPDAVDLGRVTTRAVDALFDIQQTHLSDLRREPPVSPDGGAA